ncbi:MAG: ion transporter, partial [Luteolibacter sp.]
MNRNRKNAMGVPELIHLKRREGIQSWRIRLASWVESGSVQSVIIGVILLNAVILGFETSPALMERWGGILVALDRACLGIFILELAIKLIAYQRYFWRSGWKWFDLMVIAVALIPGG